MLLRFGTRHSLLLLGLVTAGCFPYRELYRPELTGSVVDEAGKPQAGIYVETCSASRWTGFGSGCPRQFTTSTATDGRFHVEPRREWEWCCIGEAPLPVTEIRACTRDGRGATLESPPPPQAVLVLRPLASKEVPQRLRERCAAWVLGRRGDEED